MFQNSGQHVAVHDPNPPPNCIGYIHTKMSPMQVAKDASEDARSLCLREYGSAPDINIYGDPTFTFPYVRFFNCHQFLISYQDSGFCFFTHVSIIHLPDMSRHTCI